MSTDQPEPTTVPELRLGVLGYGQRASLVRYAHRPGEGHRVTVASLPVFVEKPLAITTEDADRVLATSERTGVPVYVGHNIRHMPMVQLMREQIRAGAIGEVTAIWCRHVVSAGRDPYFKDDAGVVDRTGDERQPGQAARCPDRRQRLSRGC